MPRIKNIITGSLIISLFVIYSGLFFPANATEATTVKWRVQSAWPPPEKILPDSEYFGGYGMIMEVARKVHQKTNGKFQIEVFTPGTLIATKGILNALRTGAIDMAACNGAYWGGTIPSANIESMSVGGASDPTVFVPMLTESDWLKIIRKDYARFGLYYLAPAPAASSVIMGNFEANNIEDMRKYKIAASGAKGDLFKILGIAAVTVHSTDIYPALDRKTIDAVMYSSYCLETYKFHEVVKYLIWSEIQSPLLSNMVCNMKSYEALPKAFQNALDEAGMEVAVKQLAGTNKMNDIARHAAEKYGIKQITLEGDAKKAIREGIIQIWEKYAKKSEDNAKLIKILREYAGY